MTEDEAIEELKLIKHTRIFIPSDEVWEMAIQALEDIQAYRALGTVEEIQKAMENLPLYQVEHKLLQEYQAICTVRECKIAVEQMKGGAS